ncbi:hypothetical protein SDJN03_15335, partial [Cucurbita argyrosperma subsp. sororia]
MRIVKGRMVEAMVGMSGSLADGNPLGLFISLNTVLSYSIFWVFEPASAAMLPAAAAAAAAGWLPFLPFLAFLHPTLMDSTSL